MRLSTMTDLTEACQQIVDRGRWYRQAAAQAAQGMGHHRHTGPRSARLGRKRIRCLRNFLVSKCTLCAPSQNAPGANARGTGSQSSFNRLCKIRSYSVSDLEALIGGARLRHA